MILRAGIVGFGQWGKKIYSALGPLVQSGHVDLISICDPIFQNQSLIPTDLDPKISFFSKYQDLFKKSNLHIVFIASSSNTHTEIALFSLANKVHCFVEKPFSLSKIEAESLLFFSSSKKIRDTIFYPGFILNFHPNVQKFISMYYKISSSYPIKRLRFYYSNPSKNEPIYYSLLPHVFFILFNLMKIRFPHKVKAIHSIHPFKKVLRILFSYHYLNTKRHRKMPQVKICLIKSPFRYFYYEIDYIKHSSVYTYSRYIFKKSFSLFHFPYENSSFPPHICQKFRNFQDTISLSHSNFYSDPNYMSNQISLFKKLSLFPPNTHPPLKQESIIQTPLYNEIVHFINCVLYKIKPYSISQLLSPYYLEIFELFQQFNLNRNFDFMYHPFKHSDHPHSTHSYTSTIHSDFIPSRNVLFGFYSNSDPYLNAGFDPDRQDKYREYREFFLKNFESIDQHTKKISKKRRNQDKEFL